MHSFLDTLYGRPNTIKTQTAIFNRWVAPYMHYDLTKPEYLAMIFNSWKSKTDSPNTLKSALTMLIKYANYKGIPIDSTRYRRLLLRQNQQSKIKAWDPKTARLIINSARFGQQTLLMFAYYAGLRKGEIFGLYGEDIDLNKKTITVRRSYDGPTKNGKSRVIRLDPELEKHISNIARPYGRSMFTCKPWDPNPEIRRICRQLGVMEGTLHTFRHSFATAALDAGRSVKQVQEALGHSSPSITMDLYWSNINGELELGFC